MQMCASCDKVYDESEYYGCPYCSGELEEFKTERYYKSCPNCDSYMLWDDYWECQNCDEEIHTSESDCDGIIEI